MKRILSILAAVLVLSPLVVVVEAQTPPVGQGQTTLSWTPAQFYSDGSLMVRKAHRIYHSSTQGHCLTSFITPTKGPTCTMIAEVGAGASNYVHANLFNATHYYAATTVDFFDAESFSSNEANKVINITGNVQPPAPGVIPLPPTSLSAL